jgi:hypothetical protein
MYSRDKGISQKFLYSLTQANLPESRRMIHE